MNERYQLLAALAGPALKCLMVIVWEQRQMTIPELEAYTGHDKNTVRKGLAQLALYGLASPIIASRETWTLTDKGFQLPLPVASLPSGETPIPPAADAPPDPAPAPTAGPDEADVPANPPSDGKPTIAPASGEIFTIDGSSSSGLILKPDLNIKPPLQQQHGGENLTDLPPEFEKLLASELLDGCPHARARRAIHAALERGDTYKKIYLDLSWWIMYVESPLGAGIHAPPAMFAAAKLEKGESCPPFEFRANEFDPRTGPAWRAWKTRYRWDMDRLRQYAESDDDGQPIEESE